MLEHKRSGYLCGTEDCGDHISYPGNRDLITLDEVTITEVMIAGDVDWYFVTPHRVQLLGACGSMTVRECWKGEW